MTSYTRWTHVRAAHVLQIVCAHLPAGCRPSRRPEPASGSTAGVPVPVVRSLAAPAELQGEMDAQGLVKLTDQGR